MKGRRGRGRKKRGWAPDEIERIGYGWDDYGDYWYGWMGGWV